MVTRLPPHRLPGRNEDVSPENGCSAKGKEKISVRFSDKALLRCAMDIDAESGESQVLLFYPNRNVRKTHASAAALGVDANVDPNVGSSEDPDDGLADPVGCVRLEPMFFPALQALFQLKEGEFLPMRDLPLDDDDSKDALCELLYTLHLVQTKKG
jgi:hypothetical protein